MTNHVEPKKMYFAIFGALMGFTALTVWISTIDLGSASLAVAMAIAVVKAVLVTLFFMHLRHSKPLTQFALGAGLLWLFILLGLVLSDYYTRGWIVGPAGW